MAATGSTVPISLLAAITDIKNVSRKILRSIAAVLTLPFLSTGILIILQCLFSSESHVLKIA